MLSNGVRQELTWEAHLCPADGAVCPASAGWDHRHHHRDRTTLHCGCFFLYLCYSSQFSPAMSRGEPEEGTPCECCHYSQTDVRVIKNKTTPPQKKQNKKPHIFDLALHAVGITRWEVSQNLGAIQAFPEKRVMLWERKIKTKTSVQKKTFDSGARVSHIQETCSPDSNLASVSRSGECQIRAWFEEVGRSSQKYLAAKTKGNRQNILLLFTWNKGVAKHSITLHPVVRFEFRLSGHLRTLPLCSRSQTLGWRSAGLLETAGPWTHLRADCHPERQTCH